MRFLPPTTTEGSWRSNANVVPIARGSFESSRFEYSAAVRVCPQRMFGARAPVWKQPCSAVAELTPRIAIFCGMILYAEYSRSSAGSNGPC